MILPSHNFGGSGFYFFFGAVPAPVFFSAGSKVPKTPGSDRLQLPSPFYNTYILSSLPPVFHFFSLPSTLLSTFFLFYLRWFLLNAGKQISYRFPSLLNPPRPLSSRNSLKKKHKKTQKNTKHNRQNRKKEKKRKKKSTILLLAAVGGTGNFHYKIVFLVLILLLQIN